MPYLRNQTASLPAVQTSLYVTHLLSMRQGPRFRGSKDCLYDSKAPHNKGKRGVIL